MHDPIKKMVAIIATVSVIILYAHLIKLDSYKRINHMFIRDSLHKTSTQNNEDIPFQPGGCVVVT